MPSNDFSITKNEAIKQVLAELKGPTPLEQVVERVLALWPSRAKNPQASVRQALRGWEHAGRTLIFLTDQTIAPIQMALPGITFRISLSRQEVNRGILFFQPAFMFFVPQEVSAKEVDLLDGAGRSIPSRIVTLKETKKSLLGAYTVEQTAFDLSAWYKKNKVQRDDSLLVTIVDWEAHRFRLTHEAARERKRRRAEIEQRNRELTNYLFETLEAARYESVWGREAVLTAYARLFTSGDYPGDHWLEVVEQDGRMQWTGTDIRYAEAHAPFERMLMEPGTPRVEEVSFTPEQGQQVYQFKAALKYQKGLWRRIEIQGRQTLAELDDELRDAFQHDSSDHLSGFWKLVRRGQSRRFREVDLGSIDPFGGGEAADLAIAGLDLAIDQELKYVYDFGDWIEHRLTLEAITEPQPGVEYPRITDKNKPRYRYCPHCKAEGKKTVATWICIDCSNQQQKDVLVCEDCLDTYHEDHYADEVLY
jgi:hypothetical protein